MISDVRLNDIFDALAHTKRRGIIDTLAYRPSTISQLAGEQKLSLPAMHKHVRLLTKAGLMKRKKVGRTNFVALNLSSLKVAQDYLMQYNTAWGSNDQTLENYIASLKREHKPLAANVRTNKGKRSKIE